MKGINAIYPDLENATEGGLSDEAKSDLLNRILLTLGIKSFSPKFFEVVFKDVDFSEIGQLKEVVEKFRQICMLDYGNFRYGYKILRYDVKTLNEKWNFYFPNYDQIEKIEKELRNKPKPVGLIAIEPDKLFSLGYLAIEESEEINRARTELEEVLRYAIEKKIDGYTSMLSLSQEVGKNLAILISKVAIPEAEDLMPREISQYSRPYGDLIKEIKEKCVTVDEGQIEDTQNKGIQNAYTYLAMHDLDVYVATSMRASLDFTTNWKFVQELFKKEWGDEEWHLRYFDPTQKYFGDRIQEGLMECLMIMRASVTIYNAQESDTFGKDAELGVTLAQGKPVIVYVARLFEKNEELKKIYELIDAGARQELPEFIDGVIRNEFIDKKERGIYLTPGKTKNHIIEFLIEEKVKNILNDVSTDDIAAQLVQKGYILPEKDSETKENLINKTIDIITKLEKRALIFREIHPLSLQTSPIDGVARGVMVTRDVQTTAKVLKNIFTHQMEYEIEEGDRNWILKEKITGSPIRVVAKDFVLTTAFWSEQDKYNKNK
ncbi:MAG: hypothetical protein U9Q37_10840 [Euryarchaeota archaeon]|nr:hypothetical protein [Euryarchaeota archaeon]